MTAVGTETPTRAGQAPAAAPGVAPAGGVPRILLLSGTAPGGANSGGLFLRELCALVPPEQVAWCALGRPSAPPPVPPELQGVRTRMTRPAFVPPAGSYSRWRQLRMCAAFHGARWRCTGMLRDTAVALGREMGAELVWATLDHPSVYRWSVAVADQLGLPLVTTVWDPPETHLLHFGLDGLSTRTATRDFGLALRRSRQIGVMCETMRDEYETRFERPCVVMRHGLRRDQCLPPRERLRDEHTLTIGFAGALYMLHEWRAFIAALDGAGWRVAGREVRMRLLTDAVTLSAAGAVHYEYLGYRSAPETVRLLAETDIAYLPYWFSRRYRVGARLCFPGKLTGYAAAGIPVFYHGPHDSSPRHFFDREPMAFCCHASEPKAILDELARVAGEPAAYAAAARASGAAARGELSLATFRARFAEFVGAAPEALAPVESPAAGG